MFQFWGGLDNSFLLNTTGLGAPNQPITITGSGSYSTISGAAKAELASIASPTNVPTQNGTFDGSANQINIVEVPEPSSMTLLALSGVFGFGRRKRK